MRFREILSQKMKISRIVDINEIFDPILEIKFHEVNASG